MLRSRLVVSAIVALFALVMISRTMVTLESPNDTPTLESKYADELARVIANSTADTKQLEELSSAVDSLKHENERLKLQNDDAKVVKLQVAKLMIENQQLNKEHNELNATSASMIAMLKTENELLKFEQNETNVTSSLVAFPKSENERLKSQHDVVDVVAKPLECWDKESFSHRNFSELHKINETRFDFFTDRNSRACRRARTNYGDETKFLPVLRKLANSECITVVTLGGSISYGNRVGGRKGGYSAKLIQSLDRHVPCKTATGEAGHHAYYNLAMGGTTAGFHARNIQSTPDWYDEAFSKADVIINEFAINDADGTSMMNVSGIHKPSDRVRYWNEALIQMLKLKCPQAAIIYLEASAMHWNVGEGHSKHAPPIRTDTEQHLDVLKYYDIMQIDMMRMFGPIGTQEKNEYLYHVYFMDNVHPGQWGHALIASVLSFTLREMVANIAAIETDFKVIEPNLEKNREYMLLPKDWQPLLASWSVSFKDYHMVTKHTSTKLENDGKVVDGWGYATDIPKKRNSKTLMSTEPGSCVEINNIDVPEAITQYSVNVMKSYEHFGAMTVTLLCGKETIHVEKVNCIWESHTSQLSSVHVKLEKPLADCKEVHFEVCHLESETPTKVKLFKMSLFKANE